MSISSRSPNYPTTITIIATPPEISLIVLRCCFRLRRNPWQARKLRLKSRTSLKCQRNLSINDNRLCSKHHHFWRKRLMISKSKNDKIKTIPIQRCISSDKNWKAMMNFRISAKNPSARLKYADIFAEPCLQSFEIKSTMPPFSTTIISITYLTILFWIPYIPPINTFSTKLTNYAILFSLPSFIDD